MNVLGHPRVVEVGEPVRRRPLRARRTRGRRARPRARRRARAGCGPAPRGRRRWRRAGSARGRTRARRRRGRGLEAPTPVAAPGPRDRDARRPGDVRSAVRPAAQGGRDRGRSSRPGAAPTGTGCRRPASTPGRSSRTPPGRSRTGTRSRRCGRSSAGRRGRCCPGTRRCPCRCARSEMSVTIQRPPPASKIRLSGDEKPLWGPPTAKMLHEKLVAAGAPSASSSADDLAVEVAVAGVVRQCDEDAAVARVDLDVLGAVGRRAARGERRRTRVGEHVGLAGEQRRAVGLLASRIFCELA